MTYHRGPLTRYPAQTLGRAGRRRLEAALLRRVSTLGVGGLRARRHDGSVCARWLCPGFSPRPGVNCGSRIVLLENRRSVAVLSSCAGRGRGPLRRAHPVRASFLVCPAGAQRLLIIGVLLTGASYVFLHTPPHRRNTERTSSPSRSTCAREHSSSVARQPIQHCPSNARAPIPHRSLESPP